MTWLTGYSYRKSHEIHAATGAGTSYQVKITVHWGAGVDNVSDVYLNSHGVDTSFGDVRFTDDDGETELKYWMESHVDSDNAVFWVKVADSLETDPQTIYIYYGKAATSTTSSAVDTLVYFHNFEGETVGQPPTKFLETTYLTIQADTAEGTRCVRFADAGPDLKDRMDSANIAGLCLCMKMKTSGNMQASFGVRYVDAINYIHIGGIYGNPANFWGIGQLINNVWTETHTAFSWGTGWHDVDVKIYAGSCTAIIDATSVTRTNLTLTSAGKAFLLCWNDVTAYFDYIRIRKYCNPEPVQHTWGNEEVPATTYNQSCTQTFTSTPSNLFNIGLMKTQSLSVNGIHSLTCGFGRLFEQTLNLVDSFAQSLDRFVSLGENFILNDISTLLSTFRRTVSEGVSLSGVHATVSAFERALGEAIGFLDEFIPKVPILLVLVEGLHLVEARSSLVHRTLQELRRIRDRFMSWGCFKHYDKPRQIVENYEE